MARRLWVLGLCASVLTACGEDNTAAVSGSLDATGAVTDVGKGDLGGKEIGRASCRERV